MGIELPAGVRTGQVQSLLARMRLQTSLTLHNCQSGVHGPMDDEIEISCSDLSRSEDSEIRWPLPSPTSGYLVLIKQRRKCFGILLPCLRSTTCISLFCGDQHW